MSKPTQSSNYFPLDLRRFGKYLTAGILALFVAISLVPSGPVLADPLDGPRSSGVVGERFDGYAEIKDAGGATGAIKALVQDINKKRKQFYSSKAQSEGAPPDQIGRIYAEKIFQKAPGGYWFKAENGSWRQK